MNFLTNVSTNSYNRIPDIAKVYDEAMAAPRSVQIVRGEIDDGRVQSPHRDGPDYTDLFPGG